MFKLLIVDDERNTREGLIECIDWPKLGVSRIEQAEDGAAALEKAKSFKPNIIICDIRMPKMNGLEFSGSIKNFLPESKIIFLSGYSDKEYLKTAIKLQAVDYIEKPVVLDKIREAVGSAVSLLLEKTEAPFPEQRFINAENKNVAAVMRYILKNLSDANLSLKSISEFSMLTPAYVCSIFKAETGKTVNRYITDARMEKAKKLLLDKKLKIHTVAKMAGYADTKYFARLFRKNTGVKPSEFREGNLL